VSTLSQQLFGLFILALPVSTVAWTVTHEEIFREFREECAARSKQCAKWYQRKFFYLLTCEYCFSHYVTALFLVITRFKLLLPDWRGYLISLFSVVWMANIYMSFFGRLRLDIKHERVEIAASELDVSKKNDSKKPQAIPYAVER
jgi:hypothetical protein